MRIPRFSLIAAMLAVVLIAVDLAALRYIYRPDPGDLSGNDLFMSLLPMSNALAIVLFRGVSRGGLRGQPFALGFLIAGSAMLIAYVLYDRLFPDSASRLFSLPRGPFIRFCRAHLPWFVWKFPDGTSYFRYYALLSLCYSWPQFIAAGLGGLIASRVARPAGRRILA